MTHGDEGPGLADVATVTAWDPAEPVGVVTTDDAGHEVWLHASACGAGLSASDLRVGLRIRVTYAPVEDQDGLRWRALTLQLVDSTHVVTDPAAMSDPGEAFSTYRTGEAV